MHGRSAYYRGRLVSLFETKLISRASSAMATSKAYTERNNIIYLHQKIYIHDTPKVARFLARKFHVSLAHVQLHRPLLKFCIYFTPRIIYSSIKFKHV